MSREFKDVLERILGAAPDLAPPKPPTQEPMFPPSKRALSKPFSFHRDLPQADDGEDQPVEQEWWQHQISHV